MVSTVSAKKCWAILSICGLIAASETLSAQSAPLPKPPAPGFLRLPGQVVRSDFGVSPLRIPGASMETDSAERTIVTFVRPMNIHLCSTDPTDPCRPFIKCDFFYNGWDVLPPMRIFSAKPVSTGNEHNYSLFGGPHGDPIEAPARHSFLQRRVHRLKLTDIANYLASWDVPVTLEVMAADSRSKEFLSRNAVPVEFTDEDFKSVIEAGTVIKVYYLPNALDTDDDDSGSGVRVSTHSGSAINGVDPIYEARQRGSVLLVIRMGIGQIFSESLAVSPPRLVRW